MAGDSLQTLPKGHALGRYSVQRLIGAGTFGNVYLCSVDDADGTFAVREYLPRGLAVRGTDGQVQPQSPAAAEAYQAGLRQFVDRAAGMQRVGHPNLVPIHDVVRAHNTAYAVMDVAVGQSLAALLGDSGTLSESRLAQCLLPILDGIAAMHETAIAHGNIGPGSVIVRDDGIPVLLGLAAPASDQFGHVAKPGYAPIEHYSSRAQLVDARADIYSLGAMMYRCVTGVVPPEPPVRVERDTLIPAARAARGRMDRNCSRQSMRRSLCNLCNDPPALRACARRWPATRQRRKSRKRPSGGRPPPPARLWRVTRGRREPASRTRRLVYGGVAAAGVAVVAAVLIWQGGGPQAPVPEPPTPAAAEPAPATDALPLPAPVGVDPPPAEVVGVDPAATEVADSVVGDEPELAEAEQAARLFVASTPPGVEVLLDGVSVGETPLELDALTAGSHGLSLRHPLYETLELDEVVLTSGETTRLERALTRATGSLRVSSVPAGGVDLDRRRAVCGDHADDVGGPADRPGDTAARRR